MQCTWAHRRGWSRRTLSEEEGDPFWNPCTRARSDLAAPLVSGFLRLYSAAQWVRFDPGTGQADVLTTRQLRQTVVSTFAIAKFSTVGGVAISLVRGHKMLVDIGKLQKLSIHCNVTVATCSWDDLFNSTRCGDINQFIPADGKMDLSPRIYTPVCEKKDQLESTNGEEAKNAKETPNLVITRKFQQVGLCTCTITVP